MINFMLDDYIVYNINLIVYSLFMWPYLKKKVYLCGPSKLIDGTFSF